MTVRHLIAVSIIALTASAAMAADAPLIVDPAVSAGYDWTGFYVGVFGGVSLQLASLPGSYSYYEGDYSDYYRTDQQTVGGELGVAGGYSAQIGSFVLGGEADIAWTNLSIESDKYAGYVETQTNWISTLRVKAGMVLGDGVLVYGTAGLAAADMEALVCYDESCDAGYEYEIDGVRLGLTVGIGTEARLTDNLTVDAKLLYTQLETATADVPYSAAIWNYDTSASFDASILSARAGLNWHFN